MRVRSAVLGWKQGREAAQLGGGAQDGAVTLLRVHLSTQF